MPGPKHGEGQGTLSALGADADPLMACKSTAPLPHIEGEVEGGDKASEAEDRAANKPNVDCIQARPLPPHTAAQVLAGAGGTPSPVLSNARSVARFLPNSGQGAAQGVLRPSMASKAEQVTGFLLLQQSNKGLTNIDAELMWAPFVQQNTHFVWAPMLYFRFRNLPHQTILESDQSDFFERAEQIRFGIKMVQHCQNRIFFFV